jgi:uncharacterized surface protein with fasciclin (FAS1) repeats
MPHTATRLLLALLLLPTLMLTACGGGSAPPAATPTPRPTSAPPTATPAPANLVETAARSGALTTLVAAVDAAGLTEKLTDAGPYTIFAPTDDAFAGLPAGALQRLLADPEGELLDILLYHVAAGETGSDALADGLSIPTLLDAPLTVARTGDGVTVNGSTVITPDVQATNGVIHVVDQVLLPPGFGQ